MSPAESRALAAWAFVERNRTGVLCTNSLRLAGYPNGSVMPYAVDSGRRPLFSLSSLALHSRNLAADPRACLLVAEPAPPGLDPLGLPRVSLFGAVAPVAEGESRELAERYLARHPAAADWIGLGGFGIYRMEVEALYFIGGFGEMGWVEPDGYRNAGR